MKRFTHILVAFDSSSDSTLALETAQTMAMDHQSQLTVAYVDDASENRSSIYAPTATTAGDDINMTQSQPVIPGPGPMPIMPDYKQENRESMSMKDDKPDRVMLDAKSRISDTINANYEILTGKPAGELTHYAEENDVDLIVVGNRGLSGIKKLVMGSVSQKITNQAPCAVFIVK